MNSKIGVGIIGASPDRGWASDAHIPALHALNELEFVALSTSRAASAEQAAKQFNIALAFDNYQALVSRPEVDVVAVTVKVPHHFELVSAAINAGKAVYCEWPLGNGLQEAEVMAAAAKEKGLYAAVGLQARSSPVIAYVKQLLAEGFVGEVLSSTIVADAINWGADVIDCYKYLLDRKNGASMLTIPFGHTMDAFCWTLGEFAELSATLATRRPQVTLVETGEKIPTNVADQIAVTGILESGAVAAIHFRGGLSRGTHFRWEINGSDGDLVISAGGGHIQMLPMSLKGARGEKQSLEDMPVPPSYNPIGDLLPDGPAASVGRAYARMANDLRAGTQTLPSFADAVVRHRMLEAIVAAANSGQKQRYKTSY
ncbi:MAG: Gfo/Idh/MocA family oxidoreductase [Porticoccaceae bacterium]|nr:Gfo/Idh/MocA family oxidoreductase [Porticoccaceae bacterium]